MKNIFTLVLLSSVIFNLTVFGQSKRLALVEEFTNTGCGPCAKVNPHLDSCLNVKLGDAISIKYHVFWPDANDPMYLHNQNEVRVRNSYYKVTGVPAIFVDGKTTGTVNSMSSDIDKSLQAGSPIEFNLTYNLNKETGLLDVNSELYFTNEVSGNNLRLFLVVIEEHIIFDEPFGNDESEFHNVMKKMLPDENGYVLPSKINKGETIQYSAQWQTQNFYNIDELGVVGFVQDITTGTVYQAAYAPKVIKESDKASLVVLTGMPNRICIPEFSCDIKLRNDGNNDLTKCTINVSVNSTQHSFPWTGNLKLFQSEVISIPSFSDYTLSNGMNAVKAWITDVNGTSNQSNEFLNGFYSALSGENQIELTVFTDKKPSETTWKLFDSSGDIIDQGGPYEEQRKTYKKMLDIKTDGCYQIQFYDSGNDGICCKNGNGYVKFTVFNQDKSSKILFQGSYQESEFDLNFSMKNVTPLSIQNNVIDNQVSIYPNPSDGIFNITLPDNDVQITVYNMSGKIVKNIQNINGVLDLSQQKNGIYFIHCIGKKINSINKIVLNR